MKLNHTLVKINIKCISCSQLKKKELNLSFTNTKIIICNSQNFVFFFHEKSVSFTRTLCMYCAAVLFLENYQTVCRKSLSDCSLLFHYSLIPWQDMSSLFTFSINSSCAEKLFVDSVFRLWTLCHYTAWGPLSICGLVGKVSVTTAVR